ncbi:hypothetical protein OIE68_45820 [Nocardia vinacea]|uniref:hypothetical protein n=1 Tax=Nocardia vinacea TaxID=96468 RepID=UPI002E159728|nr:hypothetical protein OIE68_45820 [Nocardia vinacea]
MGTIIAARDVWTRCHTYEYWFGLASRVDPDDGRIMLPVGYGADVDVVCTSPDLGARLRATLSDRLSAPIIASTITDPITRIDTRRWLFLVDSKTAPNDAAAALAADPVAAELGITCCRGQITLPTPGQRTSVWMALPSPTGLPPFTRLVAYARNVARHM